MLVRAQEGDLCSCWDLAEALGLVLSKRGVRAVNLRVLPSWQEPLILPVQRRSTSILVESLKGAAKFRC